MKIKLFLFFFLILASSTYALDESYIFEQNSNSSLIISCIGDDDLPCGTGTDCYITVLNPDSNIILTNGSMTNNLNYYNYTLNSTQTEEQGIYSSFVTCNGSTSASTSFTFLITRSGKVLNTWESILYLGLTTFAFIIFLLALFVAIKTPYQNERDGEGNIMKITKTKYWKMAFMMITYGLFIWFINMLLGLSNNFTDLNMFYGFTNMLFNILINLMYPLFVILFLASIFEIVRDLNKKKALELWGKA